MEVIAKGIALTHTLNQQQGPCFPAQHAILYPVFLVHKHVVLSCNTYEAQTFTLTSSSKKEILFGTLVVTSNFGSTGNAMRI